MTDIPEDLQDDDEEGTTDSPDVDVQDDDQDPDEPVDDEDKLPADDEFNGIGDDEPPA